MTVRRDTYEEALAHRHHVIVADHENTIKADRRANDGDGGGRQPSATPGGTDQLVDA